MALTLVDDREWQHPLLVAVEEAMFATVPDTTPGIPLSHYGSKKEMWIEEKSCTARLVLERLAMLLRVDPYPSSMDAEDLIRIGYRDPIYLFIKDEPHKEEKIKLGRYRLISSVSLIDNLVERVLFSTHNKWEIQNHQLLSNKPGMGLHDDGLKELYSWFTELEKNYPLCSSDISAWDWSVPGWLMDLDTRYRKHHSGGAHALLIERYMYGIQMKVFTTPHGLLIKQTTPGIVASGTYNTSSSNSHMRAMLAHIARLRLGFEHGNGPYGAEMGDDAVEIFVPGLKEEYTRLGFTCKGVEQLPKGVFSFCSTFWDGSWEGRPENWKRSLFRFLFQDRSREEFPMIRDQLSYDFRHLNPDDKAVLDRVDDYVNKHL